MSYTGNIQQQIGYGSVANDGTGDPLRTAFVKTDDNFDAIWYTGPVGSNVRIQNNVVSTMQTNQDLVLTANGTANVKINNNIVPGTNNTWYLGNNANRWYGAYIGSAGIVVSGNVTGNNVNSTTSVRLPVFANTTVRDSSIASPLPGMIIFVTGTGLQVRGATAWNTVSGTAT